MTSAGTLDVRSARIRHPRLPPRPRRPLPLDLGKPNLLNLPRMGLMPVFLVFAIDPKEERDQKVLLFVAGTATTRRAAAAARCGAAKGSEGEARGIVAAAGWIPSLPLSCDGAGAVQRRPQNCHGELLESHSFL